MANKPTASKSALRPDARYDSLLVSKFINCMMRDGKKSTIIRIFYQCLDEIGRRLNMEDGREVEVFFRAVDNVKPAVEIQSKRVGGATYQVPMRVEQDRQTALAIRWIIQSARGKKGRPMYLKLADELMAASRGEGESMTKRENVHRMAEANKAFAHFAH